MTLDPINNAIRFGIVLGMAGTVIVICITSLIGVHFGHEYLSSWGGEQVMAHSTAVSLILLSVSIILICCKLRTPNP